MAKCDQTCGPLGVIINDENIQAGRTCHRFQTVQQSLQTSWSVARSNSDQVAISHFFIML